MMRPAPIVAIAIACGVLLGSAAPAAPDLVKEKLRQLKARLKAAKAQAAPPPKPAASEVGTGVRRMPRSPRSYSRPQASKPRTNIPSMPVIKYDVDYVNQRVGSIPKTGDIVVETTNRGQIVFAYWRVDLISGPDGMGLKKDLAPAKYQVMLKGPSLRKPWSKFVQVKPDMTAVLKVQLPPGS